MQLINRKVEPFYNYKRKPPQNVLKRQLTQPNVLIIVITRSVLIIEHFLIEPPKLKLTQKVNDHPKSNPSINISNRMTCVAQLTSSMAKITPWATC